MLKSSKLKLLFAHVPKSGGSAFLRNWLPHLDKPDGRAEKEIDTHGWQPLWHWGNGMHGTWREEHEWVEPLLEEGWTFAAIVRPPWERLASLYRRIDDREYSSIDEFVAEEEVNPRFPTHHLSIYRITQWKCNFWMPYVELQDASDGLAAILGVDPPDMSPRANHTPDRRPDHEVLTPRAMEFVKLNNQSDINYFMMEEAWEDMMNQVS